MDNRGGMDFPFPQPREEDVKARHFLVAVMLIVVIGLACLLMLIVNGAMVIIPISTQLGLPRIRQSFIVVAFAAIVFDIAAGLLLRFVAQRTRLRAMGGALLWGGALAATLTSVRLMLPLEDVVRPSMARMMIGLLFTVPVLWRAGWPNGVAKLPIAIIVGGAMLLPFVVNGALGSVFDAVRAFAEALVLGLVAASLAVMLRPAIEEDDSGVMSIGLAGMTITIVLLLVAGSWGQRDLNLLLMLVLPWLGRLIAALAKARPNFVTPDCANWQASALLVLLAALGVLAFVSPAEFNAMTIIDR